MGRSLGAPGDPLLVSVRSRRDVSMPGMMETVLNVGLNDESVQGLASSSDNPRFAHDSYRRLLHMFGGTVLGIEGELFRDALDDLKKDRGTTADTDLGVEDLQELVETYKAIIEKEAGRPFPQEPREQLDLAVRAVFDSWNTDRAVLYRRQEQIPEDLGTAVNIQAMVFGNFGADSGSGVCFTRDPASGDQGVYGDYLQNAQGEDVVAGIRNTVSLADMAEIDKASHDELLGIMSTLEHHYKDMCDIEFTVERGKLWMLQTRVGKRTPEAAFRIAVHMADEGLIDMDEALRRVNGEQLANLMFPRFDEKAERTLLAKGMNASPGAAVGKAVFDWATAVEWAERGEDVILVRKETTPDDLHGMMVARGVLTSRGGKTSHAAVVARGMGRTCVCGAEALDVDAREGTFVVRGGPTVSEGDVISIDGSTGEVFLGAVPVTPSSVVRHFEGEQVDEPLVDAVIRLMEHADAARRMKVRTNADTADDAARARRFGAQGIGLCRTEHMFLGDRRQLVENLIVADDDAGQEAALAELLPLQREDFTRIFEAMDGLPVTIRLIDPPLHEFLPDLTELSVKLAIADSRGQRKKRRPQAARGRPAAARAEPDARPARRTPRHRHPAPVHHAGAGDPRGRGGPAQGRRPGRAGDHDPAGGVGAGARHRPRPDPGHRHGRVQEEQGIEIPHLIGTMIELPRAALTAGRIAGSADFFSFGTNDLTQMTWGFSRDDVEASFFSTYLEQGDLPGLAVRVARHRGRRARWSAPPARPAARSTPDLKLGVCGEHGGDPASIHFFDDGRARLRLLLAVPGPGRAVGGRPVRAVTTGSLARVTARCFVTYVSNSLSACAAD